jgi:chloride channel 3/4/5
MDLHNHEPPQYEDGDSVDWLREQSTERERHHRMLSQRGIKALLWPFVDACGMWSVIVLTGIGIGLVGVRFSKH